MANAATNEHARARAPASLGSEESSQRPSTLAASSATRLVGVSLVIAALWAGVYWALH